ncbi:MAG: nucleoside triphosphate pyrophosphohydrolase [Clostridia bacterium]|nr:nucleoside triphosphate pyrophosphohydrolase [Clostridia bacterium]
MIKYNKLVRDRIPEIIEASGKTCDTEILSDAEYISMLDAKLNEELLEYQESKSMEELADLLEVMRSVAAARGSSIEEVENIRRKKAEKRGGFEKRILLKEVREEEEK